ncbi:MAG TPA: hypothetical protein ENK74_08165 [Nitratifractor sp.]|nr:hypothetical protein [Nitratifractor sp.]
MLKGLLDNVMPSNYGIYSDNRFNRGLSSFFSKLMGLDFVVKSLIKDVGDALIFFCEYDERIKEYQEYSQKVFSACKGGTYGLKGVDAIVIEKTKENENWEKIGEPSDENSVKLVFEDGAINKLDSIILNAKQIYDNKVIMIGEVRFSIL